MESSKKVRAIKSLGQNFLADMHFLHKIVFAADIDCKDYDCIVEIGPGMGVLTKSLLKYDLPVYVIEKDYRCVEFLQQNLKNNNLHIIQADALSFDFNALPGKKRILVANLPYNVSVPIILNYLKNPFLFDKFCVLIQKEVAERLAGNVNSRDYGRLAVLAQTYCNVKKHFQIPGNAFKPKTKVTSTFISLMPLLEINHSALNNPSDEKKLKNNIDFDILSGLLEKCFAYRRKMLRKSLAPYPDLLLKLQEMNISNTLRAEQLEKEVFWKLV